MIGSRLQSGEWIGIQNNQRQGSQKQGVYGNLANTEQWLNPEKWQKGWKEIDLRSSQNLQYIRPNDCLYVWDNEKKNEDLIT